MSLQEPLLKYRSPAVACPPPLVLQVTPALPPESAGPKQSVLIVVQYCVNPRLAGPLRDVTLTLQTPKPLGQPGKVTLSVHLCGSKAVVIHHVSGFAVFLQCQRCTEDSLHCLFDVICLLTKLVSVIKCLDSLK